MATARLVPSTYYLSSSSYLSVSNAANMYDNTDSTTHATVTNSRTSTSSYYIYLRGFNFDAIPSNAIVSSYTIKLKANESGVSTSSSYCPYLADGTTTLSSYSDVITTTVTTHTFSSLDDTWEELVARGSDFGIRINCRRASRNTTSYVYIYGAEIEVTYTIPDPRTLSVTLNGNGTVSPSGTSTVYDGDDITVTITPSNTSDTVTVTNNGTDVTSQLEAHYAGGSTASTVLGTYTLISGGFNSGSSWFKGIVGNGYDTTDTTTSNYYSSSSSTHAVFQYSMAITNVPSNATIERVYVMVNGHAESTSNASEYMCVQLKSGDTEITEQLNFKDVGTSNSTQTLEATDLPTVSQLSSMVRGCTLGYYGGAINGATVFVEYSVPGSGVEYYTYDMTISQDTTIVVTIGGSAAQDTAYIKVNGTWTAVAAVYKKVSGAWVLQSSLSNVFDSGTNYVLGG